MRRRARRASNEPPFLDEREEEAPAERRRGRRGRCRRARRCHRVRECDRARAVGSSGRAYLAVRGIFAAEHRGVACVVRAPPRERVRVCPARPCPGAQSPIQEHPGDEKADDADTKYHCLQNCFWVKSATREDWLTEEQSKKFSSVERTVSYDHICFQFLSQSSIARFEPRSSVRLLGGASAARAASTGAWPA